MLCIPEAKKRKKNHPAFSQQPIVVQASPTCTSMRPSELMSESVFFFFQTVVEDSDYSSRGRIKSMSADVHLQTGGISWAGGGVGWGGG